MNAPPGYARFALFACLAGSCPGPLVHGADPAKPVTAPSTAPTPATAPVAPPAPQQPSPKAVALAFTGFIDKGDASAAKALLPPGSHHAQWVDATVALAGALKKLDAAATGRFGETGKTVSQNQLHLVDSAADLEKATETIEGDTATLTIAGRHEPLRLKRVQGNWQLQLPTSDPSTLARQITLLNHLTQAADRTATEIAAGQYADPQSAAKAFAARVLDARLNP